MSVGGINCKPLILAFGFISLPTLGSKHNRRKANGKVLGRSPLTILQDDNSPGTLTPRQVKGERVKTVTKKSRVEGGKPFYPIFALLNSVPPCSNSHTAFGRVSGLLP